MQTAFHPKNSLFKPSTAQMILSQFPPEVLGLILEQTSLVIPLWKCGNSALNYSLASGVQSVSLSHIACFEFNMPRILLNLRHLRFLGLKSNRRFLQDPKQWPSVITTFPSGIESLTLDSEDCTELWHQCAPKGPNEPYLVSTALPNLQTLTMRPSWSSSGSQLSGLPPTLTSLSTPLAPKLPCMSKLPRSLTYWGSPVQVGAVSDTIMDEHLKDCALAPPGLTFSHIELSWAITEKLELLKQLPPSILSLNVVRFTADAVAHFPRSIIKLELTTSISGKQLQSIIQWPPNLQLLLINLSSIEAGVIASLPRTLKELILRLPEDSELNPEEFPPLNSLTLSAKTLIKGRLPASLTLLRTSELERFDSLPSSLFDLLITSVFQSRPMHWAFPPRLLKLILMSWHANWFELIPRSVTSLTFNKLQLPDSNSTVDVYIFSRLKADLVDLTVVEIEGQSKLLHPRSFEHLRYLRSLFLTKRLALPHSSIQHLPRSLRQLSVEAPDVVQNPISFRSLPPHLTSCTLANLCLAENLTDYWPPSAWRCFMRLSADTVMKTLLNRAQKTAEE